MKRYLFLILATGYLLLTTAIAYAQNTHLSDYQFQLDRYRSNYAEYLSFKADYDERPTLSNEQKAILSARQAIISRELAWGNFVLVLSDAISLPGINYPFINKSITDLSAIANYHLNQAIEAGKISTRSDLTAFTKKELSVNATYVLPLIQAQVANKLATLIKFQIDAKAAYDVLLPQLELVKDDITVRSGLDQINTYSQQINEQIDELAQKASELDISGSNQNQFFSDTSLAMAAIRSLQNRLVTIIIDLDTNYVRH
jgi:hypothetical protein